MKQKSKRESKESQLPSKSEGCNERTRFQGQLRFPGKLGMCPSLAEPDSRGFSKSIVSKNEPQATKKFFGAAVFQKCCRVVGEQPTFAKQMKLHDEKKQKSKRESEESQLPSKSEGCNERYGFRGDCDSQASWGCAPALPNRIRVVFQGECFM